MSNGSKGSRSFSEIKHLELNQFSVGDYLLESVVSAVVEQWRQKANMVAQVVQKIPQSKKTKTIGYNLQCLALCFFNAVWPE